MNKFITSLLFCLLTITGFSQLRISQAYGGGGNASATYNQDFVEIFNAGTTAVTLNGHSVQYASATGPSGAGDWTVTVIPDGTTIGAGKYLLVALATGANGIALPTADVTNTLMNLSGTAGKVALVNVITPLNGTTACNNAAVVDVLGYGGTATCSETAVFVTTGITTAQSIQRKSNGCTDVNNNSTDFALGTVNPRNSASAANLCIIAPILSATNVSGLVTDFGVASTAIPSVVSGADLTGFPGNITVSSGSTNFEVSLNSTTGFGPSVTIPYTSATLVNTNVFVRIASLASGIGLLSSTLTVSGGGAPNAIATISGNALFFEPNVQASNIVVSNIANNSFDINWTNGNGESRIVVVRQTAAAAVAPTEGTAYTASTDVTTAPTTGGGNFVVFSGTGAGPISITGLIAGTNYTVQAYEFNGNGGGLENYLTSTAVLNPVSTTTTGISPNLTQVNFTSESTPLYMASGTSTRLPVLYYASVSNLLPNTVYKYYTQGAISTDLNTTNGGAGNPILFDYTVSPVTYAYTSSPSLTTAGGFGKFRTDASGRFTGTFGFVHSGNARFAAGTSIIPTIILAEESATTVQNRFALNQTITVLTFATTAGPFDGSFIQGTSSATPGNIVAIWNNTTAVGRPLAMTISENPTFTGTWPSSFITGYNILPGSWNTIIPNTNAGGVQLIQQINLVTGAIIGCNSDADGTWPTGPVVTSSPVNGVTPLLISSTDAPLIGGACFNIVPVTIEYVNGQKTNNGNLINWKVGCLSTSITMELQRSSDVRNFSTIHSIQATQLRCYQPFSYRDVTPLAGKTFYRLKVIDIDGSISYSRVAVVLNNSNGFEVIGVYPSIVKNNTTLNITSGKNTQIQIKLIGANGATLVNKTQAIVAGSNFVPIDCATLAVGVYFVSIITNEGLTQQVQFVKE